MTTSFSNPGTDSFEGLSSGAVQLSGGYEDYSASASTVALANQKIASESHTFFQHLGPDFQSERFDRGSAGASGSMDFSIAVYGPASIAVPLQLSGQLDANVYVRDLAQGSASASYILSGFAQFDSGVAYATISCSDTGVGCGGVDFTSNFEATAYNRRGTGGQAVTVYLQVATSSIVYDDGATGDPMDRAGDSYATADPYVRIDPTWLAAHPGYAVAFSQGFTNGAAPGVPEPAAWTMMLLGSGFLGAAARRRRLLQN